MALPVTSSICAALSSDIKDESKEPTLSIFHASEDILRQFPPTHVTAGEFDPLLDDAVDFAHKLRRYGVAVRLDVYESAPHGFVSLAKVLGNKRELLEEHAQTMKRLMEGEVLPFSSEDEGGESHVFHVQSEEEMESKSSLL